MLDWVACLSMPYVYLIFYYYRIESELRHSIITNAVISLIGYFVTFALIPVASKYLLRNNLFGYDVNKSGTPQGNTKLPKPVGIVAGIVFLVVAILFQCVNYTALSSNWLVEYNAALASIFFAMLLGFVADVFHVPFRKKLLLPSIAALPLLIAYSGPTTVIIPKPLVPYLGFVILDLGWIYKLCMWLFATFCANSISINSGINGLRVGQTIIIAVSILLLNIMQIGSSTDPEYKQALTFSIYLVQPLVTTSFALLSFNWYPSSVFVGDTFTFFAGMTMAVAGILGRSSGTLLIFFAPQVLNFLLSFRQLAGIIPCPRHRLPRFDPQTGLLIGTNDGTLVNLSLRKLGRMYEQSLCVVLLFFQAFCCYFCFISRWHVKGWYK